MDFNALFFQYNPWWEGDFNIDHIVKRDQVLESLYPLMTIPEVLILTGLRRVGKTTTMKCLIHYLLHQMKVAPEFCFYVSMDDYQLSKMNLIEVIDAYRKVKKISVKQQIYVFLDEITYADQFQIQLKNLYDKGNVKCVVSSSSSSILKDDSAALTGRKRVIEVNPLNFEEYLKFKNIIISRADEALLDAYFMDYMQVGGMPEYVLHGEREYLVNLIDDIIMKDIVGYHGLRNHSVVRDFFVLLMERTGKQASINKIARILNISPDTAKRYLAMFEETYLIHLVPRYGKTNETLLSAKKIYATDIGMRNVIVGFRDKGAIFENIVFMKIKDKKPSYLYVSGQEIDFIFDQTLLEVKYHRALEGKQLVAFEDYQAKEKIVVKSVRDLENL